MWGENSVARKFEAVFLFISTQKKNGFKKVSWKKKKFLQEKNYSMKYYNLSGFSCFRIKCSSFSKAETFMELLGKSLQYNLWRFYEIIEGSLEEAPATSTLGILQD